MRSISCTLDTVSHYDLSLSLGLGEFVMLTLLDRPADGHYQINSQLAVIKVPALFFFFSFQVLESRILFGREKKTICFDILGMQ